MAAQSAVLDEVSGRLDRVSHTQAVKPRPRSEASHRGGKVKSRGHEDRVSLLRPIAYTFSSMIEEATERNGTAKLTNRTGTALGLNLGPGGILVLMGEPVSLGQVLRVRVPASLPHLSTPTLVDVRWSKRLPLDRASSAYLVGLRFLL